MKFSRTLVAPTVLTGSEVEERPPEKRRTNNAHGDSISRDCQFVPAITSLRFNATTCLARSTRNRTGDARTKRASSSNGWRLTNLTFRSAPLRGHQRRIARDRPLRSFAIVPLPPFFARAFSFSSPSFRVRPAHASPLLLALTATTGSLRPRLAAFRSRRTLSSRRSGAVSFAQEHLSHSFSLLSYYLRSIDRSNTLLW